MKRTTLSQFIKRRYPRKTLEKLRKMQGGIIEKLKELAEMQKREKEFVGYFYELICVQLGQFPVNPKSYGYIFHKMPKYWRRRYNNLQKIKKSIEELWEIRKESK